MKGRRLYLINRATHGEHREYFKRNGFNIKTDMARQIGCELPKDHYAQRWKELNDEDVNSSASFFVAQR